LNFYFSEYKNKNISLNSIKPNSILFFEFYLIKTKNYSYISKFIYYYLLKFYLNYKLNYINIKNIQKNVKNHLYVYFYNFIFIKLNYAKYNNNLILNFLKKFRYSQNPIVLPIKYKKHYIVLRSPHIYKKSFEQFMMRFYKYFYTINFKFLNYSIGKIYILHHFIMLNFFLKNSDLFHINLKLKSGK
jgi:hypothetical protein